jgi:oligopeptide transport system substrate-binding protein
MMTVCSSPRGWRARYDVLDGGRVYRFYLRRGVTYHQRPERTLRAEDVVYNWHRLANPTWASPGSYVFEGLIEGWHAYRAGQAQSISGLRTIGDSIVEVRLKSLMRRFCTCLRLPYTYIALPESVAALGRAFGERPVGTAPFACSIWKQAGSWSCSAGKTTGAARRAYPASSFNGLAIVSGPTKPSVGRD